VEEKSAEPREPEIVQVHQQVCNKSPRGTEEKEHTGKKYSEK
jgi:hypothetical protein